MARRAFSSKSSTWPATMEVSTAGCESAAALSATLEDEVLGPAACTATPELGAVLSRERYQALPAASATTARPNPAQSAHFGAPPSGAPAVCAADEGRRNASSVRGATALAAPGRCAPVARTAALRLMASAIAASSTAVVFGPSIGIVSTAKTLVPLTAEAICFSPSACANTTTAARGTRCIARCTSARTSLVARASITSICPRLVLASCSSAVSIESTGCTEACPPSASPSSSRKSSRLVSTVRSTVGRCVGDGVCAGVPAPPDSAFRGALDAGSATVRVSTLENELLYARAAAGPTGGHRAPTRLITHAKRGFQEHIALLTYRSAAVHKIGRAH